jgi:zinc D-Ala-D-Ala carboxypeptidase
VGSNKGIEMKISENITLEEATRSPIAKRYGIKNEATEAQIANMVDLAVNVFEPMREALGGLPIIVTSFFRSKELNDCVGGASNSQHLANKGAAMDIDNDRTNNKPDNIEIFNYIKDNLEFDQLICEFPLPNGSPDWVHVSYNNGKNRKQVLKCINGRYLPYI